MKKVFFLLLVTISTYAQEHNIWYFGGRAGLDFNQGSPIAIGDGKISTDEGCATISDSNGSLLFYTDGVRVWNKNHLIMENGTGLNGHASSTQSALIIPKPGSNTLYYIFTTTASAGPKGLCFSVVDIEGDGGLGTVIEKNTLLHTPTCEKLAAAWHINGTDIWVMSHEYGNDVLAAYLVTADGINTTPVTSSSSVIAGEDGAGHLKFSPNGKRLAMTSRGELTQLFDFNPATGIVENPVPLTQDNYGVEFSASGNLLYLSTNGLQETSLYQYNLQAENILDTATELLKVSPTGTRIGALQRGPDHKIYVAHISTSLSVINLPDIPGLGCEFTENSLSLFSGFSFVACRLGLPNNSLAPAYKVSIGRQPSCAGQESIYWVNSPQGTPDTVFWEFGDGSSSAAFNPSHTYLNSGNYTVRLTVTWKGITRVVESVVEVINTVLINQPATMISCEDESGTARFDLTAQNTTIIGTQNPEDYSITYYTSLDEAESGTNNISTNFTNTSNPQTIYVRMENKSSGCYATTSFELIVMSKPPINMPDVYRFCKGGNILLTAPEGFETYVWSNGETSRTITVNQPGDYTITVTQITEGVVCENSKTITVYESEAPIITQIKSTEWTVDSNTITVSVLGTGNYEYSLDNIFYQDSPEFKGLESGIYIVYVRDKDGCGMDKSEVIVMTYPKFFTPNGDGINDLWNIKYSRYEPSMKVHIFDRYGKLITSFSGNNSGWDGRYNGRDLPATDYWFVVERQDGRQYKGHFSLIR